MSARPFARKGQYRSDVAFVVFQKAKCVAERHGAGNGKALHLIAADLGQKGMFLFRFDAFGQRGDAQPVGQRKDGQDHALLGRIVIAGGHEAAVDLDPVDAELADGVEAGIAGAEIVQIQMAA